MYVVFPECVTVRYGSVDVPEYSLKRIPPYLSDATAVASRSSVNMTLSGVYPVLSMYARPLALSVKVCVCADDPVVSQFMSDASFVVR